MSRPYRKALARATQAMTDMERGLPGAVAVSIADVLPVDGASVSISAQDYRIPLGASDESAAVAESLQFTVGDGPCLRAIRDRLVVDVPAALLASRWSELAELWTRNTPYRSATSLPLFLPSGARGAVNLYYVHARGGVDVDMTQAQSVAMSASVSLDGWLGRRIDDVDRILSEAQAHARRGVWIAVGTVMNAAGVSGLDALDVLRSWAFSHETTVDDVAERLVAGGLDVHAIAAARG